MAGQLERYKKLGLRESLPRMHLYPIACKELSFILRGAYSKLPKDLQSLIFTDLISAFRLLPEMQTHTAVSAAHFLLQSAEAALPKQKRVVAVSEFKQAKVSHKRRCKAQKEVEGSFQLPQDVLVHILSFLDLKNLVSAGLVCRLWHTAASDNYLWHLQYITFFNNFNNSSKVKGLQIGGLLENKDNKLLEDDFMANIDWKEAFKSAYSDNSSKKLSYRGYCGHCDAIVWLVNMKCANEQCRLNSRNQQIKAILPEQIVEYIMEDSIWTMSSSSSESDSDSDGGESMFKLWKYPLHKARLYK